MARRVSTDGKATMSVAAYDAAQPGIEAAICKRLRAEIERVLPDATSKVWHGAPVWFVGDTPVVGYSVPSKGGVSLLFWNGQAFDERALEPVGKFQAAQARFAGTAEIDATLLRRWLKKAGTQLWDVSIVHKARAAALAKKRSAAKSTPVRAKRTPSASKSKPRVAR